MPKRSSTPVVIKVQPDGRVLYEFDGHVFATGMDMNEAILPGAQDDNRVRWLQQHEVGSDPTNDGRGVVAIYGQRLGDTKHGLFADFPQNPGTGRKIIDTDGRSAFVQVAGTPGAGPAMSGGTMQATWSVAGDRSDVMQVNHGLGRIPAGISATPITDPTDPAFALQANIGSNINAFFFRVSLFTQWASIPVGGTRFFSWTAFG